MSSPNSDEPFNQRFYVPCCQLGPCLHGRRAVVMHEVERDAGDGTAVGDVGKDQIGVAGVVVDPRRVTGDAKFVHQDSLVAALTHALAVLRTDGVDPKREAMWRYGVRHTVAVIDLALAATEDAHASLDVERLAKALDVVDEARWPMDEAHREANRVEAAAIALAYREALK